MSKLGIEHRTKAPKEPYCVNGHKSSCCNPSQCFCECHSIRSMTDSKLNQIITFHKTQIKKYQDVLDERYTPVAPIERAK